MATVTCPTCGSHHEAHAAPESAALESAAMTITRTPTVLFHEETRGSVHPPCPDCENGFLAEVDAYQCDRCGQNAYGPGSRRPYYHGSQLLCADCEATLQGDARN